MSNFFEQELRKLFEDEEILQSPQFVGRACLGTLGRDLRVRAEFVTMGMADHYAGLRLTVLNRTEGAIDKTTLRFADLLGTKKVPGNPNFRNGVKPHIWDDHGKAEWYAYQPEIMDYITLRNAAAQYLEVFRERTPERSQEGPKLVYICAPLRGEVEQNIAFAREKAQEVFRAGDVPVCPHLMFPPIADPGDPVQDQAARDMGLRLVEACQELRVYGSTLTEGMLAEISRATQMDIPVVSEQRSRTSVKKRSTRGKER